MPITASARRASSIRRQTRHSSRRHPSPPHWAWGTRLGSMQSKPHRTESQSWRESRDVPRRRLRRLLRPPLCPSGTSDLRWSSCARNASQKRWTCSRASRRLARRRRRAASPRGAPHERRQARGRRDGLPADPLEDELHAGAHYLVALCREHAGDRRAAREHDQVATYLDGGFAMPHLHLGLLARRAGDTEQARTELERALMLLARGGRIAHSAVRGRFQSRGAHRALPQPSSERVGGDS